MIGVILTLPMFLLKRFRGWRIIAGEEQLEHGPVSASTFSLAELIGWTALAAGFAGLYANAAQSNGGWPTINHGGALATMVPLTLIALSTTVASTSLLRMTIIKPPWTATWRIGLIFALFVPGITAGTGLFVYFPEIARLPLMIALPIPTFIIAYTGILMLVRWSGFGMPR